MSPRAQPVVRTCIGCRQRVEVDAAANVARLVIGKDHTLAVSAGSNGRGVWVHVDGSCLERGLTTKALARGFRRDVSTLVVPTDLSRSLYKISTPPS